MFNSFRFFSKFFVVMALLPSYTFAKDAISKTTQLSAKWMFRQADNDGWYEASVPGNVHLDLERNKLIDNPFYGKNEQKLQWIEEKDWIYKGEFNVDRSTLSHKSVEILFDGLDTYADVILNGNKLFSAENMFIAYAKEVKSYLKEGKNTLEVVFHSPIKMAMPKFKESRYIYPADNDRSAEHLSVFTRKAPYHYGWDWGPRFVTSGIWRPVYIRCWDDARITDAHFVQNKLTNEKADLSFSYEIESAVDDKGVLELQFEKNTKITKQVSLKKGLNRFDLDFTINKPEFWWPNGMGKPHLYKVTSSITVKGETCDVKRQNIGLRTIEVVNKPDSLGESFYLKVNGIPTFMKGVNYIPNDSFLGRMSDSVYNRCFADITASNMNMVRIWGGGVYEDNRFYELADRYGILVWQDFMFACTMYPSDDAFLSNVAKEAEYNIKRLRNHPSLALWCGNNEIKVGWANWGWQDKYKYTKEDQAELLEGYNKLFNGLLPDKVKALDPQRFYYDSSPISNWGNKADMKVGDNHYWGVWWGKHEFEKMNEYVPRFMSEFGFQSFPSMETIKSFSEEKDWDIESDVMKVHQKSSIGNATIREYMQRDYLMPKNFQDFVYLSQVMQAEGMRIGFEAHRRNKPFNMGTLYWQLNDVWPVVSWSGIDYYGRWKAMQYSIRKAFEPIISSAILVNDTLNVHIVSDKIMDTKVASYLRIITLDGEVVWSHKRDESIKANESRMTFRQPLSTLISGYDRNNLILVMETSYDGHTTETTALFSKVKDLNLKKATPKVAVEIKGNRAKITLSCSTLLKNIELSANGINGKWSDNFFDIVPGVEYTVWFEGNGKLMKDFSQQLSFKSVKDTYL